MEKNDDFVHLHTHSDGSALDGMGTIDKYVKTAKLRGNPAIAFTDHGNMRMYMKQHEQCKEVDIKPIYGCEFYLSPNMHRAGLTTDEKAEVTKGLPKSEQSKAIKQYEEREGIRDRWHLTVWARTQEGLKNLYKLSSAAFIDGFYYKPRIDLDALIEHKEGLTVSTGCLSSPINDQWLQGKKRAAFDFADRLQDAFGDEMMLEIQPHAIRDQCEANRLMLKLYDRFGGKNKLVTTQDAHYVEQADAPHHEVLLCIGTGSNLSSPDRFKFDGDEFHMRTRKQMREAFARHHEFIPSHLVKQGLNSTIEFADRCSAAVEVDYHKALLPDPGLPKKYKGDHDKYFKEICIQGWAWRNIPNRAATYAKRFGISKSEALQLYVDRLKHEISAIKRQGFVKYFLIVRDIYRFAREADIMFGPGRGSVGGSLVGYLMGFTIVDPIEHGLIFERFINPFRVDMPDVDMDFEDTRRGEIIEYLINKYGRDKVAQIATIGKLSGKQCLVDVSRVLEVPLAEVRQVTTSIVERSSGDERASQTIADSFKEFDICRKFNEKYPQVLVHASKLEGLAKSLGIHAAGVVTSPVPLTELTPLETRNHNGQRVIVTALDMYGAAACGLVKLDVLGLRTLTVVKECLKAIKDRHGVVIDLEGDDFDLNDPKVLDGFTNHDFSGVFQYDTTSAEAVCRGVKFVHFEDVAAMTALNRPGTSRSGLATKYVERKKNPKLVAKIDFHPKVSEITSDTLGIIVYQEHVIRIFTECAGFAPGTADSLRKTIAKKIGDETLGREREAFVAGCAEHSGIDAKTANKIMDAITFFGCIRYDTLVSTPTGGRRIDSLKPGDEIFSRATNGRLIVNRVKRVWPSGRKKLNKLVFENGLELFPSDEHFWGTEAGWKETNSLEESDRVLYTDAETVRKARTSQRSDSAERDRGEADQVPNGERTPQRAVRRDQVSSGAMGNGASSHNGEETRTFVDVERDCPSQGRKQHEQQRREFGIDDSRRAHDASQEGLQGATLRGDGLLDSGVLSGDVSSVLPSLVSRGENESGVDGWSEKDSGGIWQTSHRGKAEPSDRAIAGSSGFESEASSVVQRGGVLRAGDVESQMPSSLSALVSEAGEADTWDLECELGGELANYLVGNDELGWALTHNSYGFNKSHATEYGMIAYWCMFLKVYYPIEFYWALLKNEPDRIRIAALSKDAKKHGIELLPPHVNVSKAAFSIDGAKYAIRGSLVDIKGVGVAAADALIEAQPFASFADLFARIDRRKCHKGVIVALAKAGALDGLIPNTKWFVENAEAYWKELTRKKPRESELKALEAAALAERDYSEEERSVITSSVNPLAFGKHPIDAYKKFLERTLRVTIEEMAHEDYFQSFDGKGHYICGVIVEIKYNQIGDFHTGEVPSDAEKARMFWGKRYANVNIEESSGKQNRTKFDHHIFDAYRHVIDKGVGTPVVAHVTASNFTQTLRANFAVDIESFRSERDGVPRTLWEHLICGKHPAASYAWKDRLAKESRLTNARFKASTVGGVFCGVVTHVQPRYDKNGGLMSQFGLLGADSTFISVLCFASVWRSVQTTIKMGRLLKVAIHKKPDRRTASGWSCFYEGGQIKWLKKADIVLE